MSVMAGHITHPPTSAQDTYMAGKKGATQARPRTAAERDIYALSRIEQFLDSIQQGKNKRPVDPIRLKAAEIRYNKLRPALSAVEQTNHEVSRSQDDIVNEIKALLMAKPELLATLLPGFRIVPADDAPQQTSHNAQDIGSNSITH